MIGETELKKLLIKYNINTDNFLKNDSVITYGEYLKIDEVLNYLVNDLKVKQKYIEKCPSIVYYNVSVIKENFEYLSKKLPFNIIENTLSILSTEPLQLKETYKYVLENYAQDTLTKMTSILTISVDRIKDMENLNINFRDKKDNLSLALGRNTKEEIKKILNSKEYKEHPELFTSQVLAHTTLKDIKLLLGLPYWQDEKYKKLLSPSIVANGKLMGTKIPKLIVIAEHYNIENFINTNYLIKSPSQNYALIQYLIESELPLVIDGKIHPIFSYQPGAIKKRYYVDLKDLMKKYIYDENMFEEINNEKRAIV